MTAEKGAAVTVRVIDPKSQLVDASGKPNGTVLVGYYTANTNLFYLLPQTASTGREFTYQMTVPIATPVRFSLSSSDVTVSDNQGRGVNASGHHFSVNVGRGQPNQEVTFNVQSLAKKP